MQCVSSIEYTLLINGSVTKSFKPSQGLRQGDPLSPYIFLTCANILSISLTQVEDLKKIKGIKVNRNGLSFSHFLFAKDSLLFFRKDKNYVQNLQLILEWYCSISGQSINLAKSDAFYSANMPMKKQVGLVNTFKVNLVQQPSKYLDVQFKLRGNRVADFQFVITTSKTSRLENETFIPSW